ncbi:MAG TPA: T9SS type A sorting domain-containing protein [Bacteroidia bacterium]|nr:T9SS type A sorting domain-containing protein [Bacteroidia bacterium]
MKKNAILFSLVLLALTGSAQITVTSAIVPQYIQGNNGTNNNRTPFWCWVELSGLTPGGTYRYYTTMDSLNASPTSNGAGNSYLINSMSGTVRRTANVSLSNSAGYDSLLATNAGTYAGWIGCEPTGNGRFTPGTTLYPKLIVNNGAGGATVANRVLLSAYPVTVINYGTTASATEGTALYDSLNAAPKNFICLYDNTSGIGRPISIAITENDGMDLYTVSSIASFYNMNADTLPMRWGTIIPNLLGNGIRAIEERDFTSGAPVDLVADADGWWCSGVNTVNMTGGNSGTNLNSTFDLVSSAVIPDTVWVGLSANFNATTNDTAASIMWDFGDTATASGASTTHTYTSQGVVSVTVVISNGGCTDTIWHNVVVMLGTNIPRQLILAFDVFPNPTTGIVNVTAKTGTEKEVVVYNVLGDAVYSQTFTGTAFTADLSSLEKGVYFMRIRETIQGGKTATKRIIIE